MITEKYIAKLEQLNSARLVPDRFVMSPEAFHALQTEMVFNLGNKFYWEANFTGTMLKERIFGIPVEIDPRLEGNTVRLEIDI